MINFRNIQFENKNKYQESFFQITHQKQTMKFQATRNISQRLDFTRQKFE